MDLLKEIQPNPPKYDIVCCLVDEIMNGLASFTMEHDTAKTFAQRFPGLSRLWAIQYVEWPTRYYYMTSYRPEGQYQYKWIVGLPVNRLNRAFEKLAFWQSMMYPDTSILVPKNDIEFLNSTQY